MVEHNYKYQSDCEFESKVPKNNGIPFGVGYIDHTELDIELVGSRIKVNLGRPWATFLSDSHTKRILGIYLTFEPPSYRSCMMVMKECFRRYGRLPSTVVIDKGKEFSNICFDNLLNIYFCTKKIRPIKTSFESVCERLFGMSSKALIEKLNLISIADSGNQYTVRVWTLVSLYKCLCYWCYELYDNEKHSALKRSPKQVFNKFCLQTGFRSQKTNQDENLDTFTFSTTNTGTAKVIPNMGVRINYIYYWNHSLQNPELEQTLIPVRYDPYNIGIAYAYVKIQWVTCISQRHEKFAGCSEKLIMLIAEELHKQHKNDSKRFVVTASRLANYFDEDEQAEHIVLQRVRDLEVKELLSFVNSQDYSQNIKSLFPISLRQSQQDSFADEVIKPYDEFW